MRELLGHIESMFAIRFGHVRGLVQQPQNGLPGIVELIGIIGSRIFRRKGAMMVSGWYVPPLD